MIVSSVDAFDEVVGHLLIEGRFGRGPDWGGGIPEKGMVSVIAHGLDRQGHCGREMATIPRVGVVGMCVERRARIREFERRRDQQTWNG